MGPIVRREVMAAKCASSSEYGMLDAYVEEECMVCLESPPDAVLVECGHGGVCVACAARIWELRDARRTCPLR